MLDNSNLENLVEQEVKSVVDSRVDELFDAMKSSMKVLLEKQKFPDQVVVSSTVDNNIQDMVTKSIENLMIDRVWLDKIERLTIVNMTQKLMERLSMVDINSVIEKVVDQNMEMWRNKFKQNFETTGILDQSTQRELTVMDGAVVAESGLYSRSLSVEQDATIKGSCTVNDLVVKGSINTDNRSWQELTQTITARTLDQMDDVWSQKISVKVLDLAREQGIEFDRVKVNGEIVLEGSKLGNGVTESNLETVGSLRNLVVAGSATIHNDTLSVSARRVGVNTRDPEMALTVWDEEVCVLAGKISQDVAYLGTGRRQSLALGVNRKNNLVIDADGLVTVKDIRIDRWRISHAAQVPGHSGTRGDFVLNHDPKPDAPFAWVCLGGFKWQPLRSA